MKMILKLRRVPRRGFQQFPQSVLVMLAGKCRSRIWCLGRFVTRQSSPGSSAGNFDQQPTHTTGIERGHSKITFGSIPRYSTKHDEAIEV